jgi:hypothetical protein
MKRRIMKRRMLIVPLALAATCVAAVAQTAKDTDWAGVWHAHVAGQPTDTLTLANDTGELGGTIVLDIVSGDGGTPHVIASDPHVLVNPHIAGSSLSFQVKMRRRDGGNVMANFEVTRTAAGKATIHCMSCGANAPVIELEKDEEPVRSEN